MQDCTLQMQEEMLLLVWRILDCNIQLDAKGAVVADGAYEVAHAAGVERDDGRASVEGPEGILRRAVLVLPPGDLHHVVEPHLEPENCRTDGGMVGFCLVRKQLLLGCS